MGGQPLPKAVAEPRSTSVRQTTSRWGANKEDEPYEPVSVLLTNRKKYRIMSTLTNR